jgi:predicted amidohydrolase YtcJ
MTLMEKKKAGAYDLVFHHGNIISLDSKDTRATAVAVKGDRIACVGSDEELLRESDAGSTRLIDLNGKTVLPGLIDCHTHLGRATLIFRNFVDGRVPPNSSVKDILERVRQRVKETPKGGWIAVQGSIFGSFKLAERRNPTREELDSVAPDHPVVFVATVHAAIANTRAMEKANIRKDTPDPPGGKIERDPVTGEPDGVLREWHSLLPIMTFTEEETKASLQDMVPEYWVRQGVTSIYSFADATEFRIYQDLCGAEKLPVRIQAKFMDLHLGSEPLIKGLVTLGVKPGLGNERLKAGGVKIFVDGALMGLSAATHEPYLNMPESNYCGLLKFKDPGALNALVLEAHQGGLQLCVHAIGDKAQDWALDAYEKALQIDPRSHRHRIEHLGNLMTNTRRIERARSMNLIPITTAEWIYEEGDFIEWYLGPERKKQSWPIRSMLEAGLKVANCSDTVGATPFSINPFYGIWCAVTRQTFLGNRLVPEEAIPVKEALRLYTLNAAYSGFEEGIKGSIEPGKLADLIVLDRDILTISENHIRDIQVDMTILGGKIVHVRNLAEFSDIKKP